MYSREHGIIIIYYIFGSCRKHTTSTQPWRQNTAVQTLMYVSWRCYLIYIYEISYDTLLTLDRRTYQRRVRWYSKKLLDIAPWPLFGRSSSIKKVTQYQKQPTKNGAPNSTQQLVLWKLKLCQNRSAQEDCVRARWKSNQRCWARICL